MWTIEFAGQSHYLATFERQHYSFGGDAIRYGSFGEACTALRELVRMFPELNNTAHVSPI